MTIPSPVSPNPFLTVEIDGGGVALKTGRREIMIFNEEWNDICELVEAYHESAN